MVFLILYFFINFTLLPDNSSVKGQLVKFEGSGGYIVFITTQLHSCVKAATDNM